MNRYIDSRKMGRGLHGWLDSHFHFSFAEYYNPSNMQFGDLRVLNDDIVQPGTGFDTHPHRDMEIISYVVNGSLTHKDSMGNEHTLTRGQVQYMSAGTGVFHSEYNQSSELLRFLQIWILPDGKGYEPNYGDYRFKEEDRYERWLPIASGFGYGKDAAPVKIHADIHMFASMLPAGETITFPVADGRQVYLVLVEGQAKVGDVTLGMRDALEVVEEDIRIRAEAPSHFVLIEEQRKDTLFS